MTRSRKDAWLAHFHLSSWSNVTSDICLRFKLDRDPDRTVMVVLDRAQCERLITELSSYLKDEA